MARPRTNDPLDVSDDPNVITDPTRIAELVEEMQSRLAYVVQSYHTLKASGIVDIGSLNSSRARLRAAAADNEGITNQADRLHPLLELSIAEKAREMTSTTGEAGRTKLTTEAIDAAARAVAASARTKRGARSNLLLRHHVEGLMAIFQMFSGTPIGVRKERNGVYDPHGSTRAAELLIEIAQGLEPGTPKVKITNMITDARRKYAGKAMRFIDLFPGYGAELDPVTGVITRAGREIARVEWAPPIYCP